jgi:hypothetical protein
VSWNKYVICNKFGHNYNVSNSWHMSSSLCTKALLWTIRKQHNINKTPLRTWRENPLGRPRRRWEDNIWVDLGEIGFWEGVEWMHLAQDTDQWRYYVNTVLKKAGNLTEWLLASQKGLCAEELLATVYTFMFFTSQGTELSNLRTPQFRLKS